MESDFLNYYEKQLILYTKNHFSRIDYERDLKYFASKLYALSLERTSADSINHMIVNLYQKLVDYGYLNFKLDSFITQVFRMAWWDSGKIEINIDLINEHLLSEIQIMRVRSLHVPDLELGEAEVCLIER